MSNYEIEKLTAPAEHVFSVEGALATILAVRSYDETELASLGRAQLVDALLTALQALDRVCASTLDSRTAEPWGVLTEAAAEVEANLPLCGFPKYF
jgi:hypothetical protein